MLQKIGKITITYDPPVSRLIPDYGQQSLEDGNRLTATGNTRTYAGAGVFRVAQETVAEGAEYLWD